MEKSKVYFTDFRTPHSGMSIPQKLQKLIKKAGIGDINFDKQFAAIKIHFGEPGNISYLRPNFAKAVVDVIKELGGKPFLTDCNTLYVGRRKEALEHMDSAYENGFSPFSTGCHVIIADGLKGTDEVLIPVEGGEYVKEAKIGRAVMDADVFISLSHFKGHEEAGFGGALKNIGMGCGSRAGKMEQHSAGKPHVKQKRCVGCQVCAKICAHDAISFEDKKATINHDKCVGCGRCIGICNFDAVKSASDATSDILNMKMVEYALAVVKDRPQFHISLICDVSPNCDCHAENDAPIVPNIGMLASFDMVALDKACIDLVNKQTAFEKSAITDNLKKYNLDKFKFDNLAMNHPSTNWKSQIEHAEKLGLGNSEYELIEIK